VNHFAHLVLSQPTIESTVGNLLGDFARGVDLTALEPSIVAGLLNHRAVDRFTDSHPHISRLKTRFSPRRRRFAGIALDIYFDHLLISDWSRFETGTPEQAIEVFYQRMDAGQFFMPGEEMRRVTARIVRYDWFGSYRYIDSVARALDRVAGRIRFANQFDNAMEDLLCHEEEIRDVFRDFYPQLKSHISTLGIETRCQDSLLP